MKFLIDADCPRAIGIALKERGHEVLDVRDSKPAATDGEIYSLIQKESLILITRDTDFGNILRYPVTAKCGIILLRTHLLAVSEISAIIQDFISSVTEKDLRGSLAVIRKNRYRIHKI